MAPSAPPIVYLLALAPALLWGFQPILSKRGMNAGGSPLQASLVVVVVDTGLFWSALAVQSVLTGRELFPGLTLETLGLFLVAGLVGTALGRITAFAGVQRLGASVNSAALSTRPLFATMLAVGLISERVTLVTVVGVVVLVGGLVVLSTSKGGDLRGWEPRDLLFPLGSALSFALGNVIRRYGLQATPTTALEAVALNEVAAMAALVGFALARDRTDVLQAPRRTYAFFAGSGTLTALALLSVFAALAHPAGRVVIVDPLGATAPLFTVLFASFLLGDLESVTRRVATGATLIVAGAALVTI